MNPGPLLCLVMILSGCQAIQSTPVVTPPVPGNDVVGRVLIERLQQRGSLSKDDSKVITTAAALNPGLLVGATNKALGMNTATVFLSRASDEDIATFRTDLLNRAALQAINSGIVTSPPTLKDEIKPALGKIAYADMPSVVIPEKLSSDIYKILLNQVFIANPACDQRIALLDRSTPTRCQEIEWDRKQFVSVLKIEISPRSKCTGVFIGGGKILTAAHCVIDSTGRRDRRIDSSLIKVLSPSGKRLSLVSAPMVPDEVLNSDCSSKCGDNDYDFAVLKVAETDTTAWTPVANLTNVSSPGSRRITIAGYGESNYSGGQPDGLLIGPLTVNLSAPRQSFVWDFDAVANPIGSSFCRGDSGGPIFDGEPMKVGIPLQLIGLISRYVSSSNTCLMAQAYAVNFSQPGPKKKLCSFIGSESSFCAP
ncbi:trypsin-like serine protease [Pseudomonas mandelii]|uniref:Peptidase S1 domain-containing protein n=1 Tax=Pseudomonas mandelii TaxID=75612 RepID=A0A502HJ92_9PSED|nr:trypsin-like serine protease [Pseudomonas mandelii]TPG73755.1 hypothetical protein EAH74_32530 [Pseudomonas mandelii]